MGFTKVVKEAGEAIKEAGKAFADMGEPIKLKPLTHKFKVGDTVTLTDNGDCWKASGYWLDEDKIKEGKVYTVSHLSKANDSLNIRLEGKDYSHPEDQFKFADADETPIFKVGDRVELISSDEWSDKEDMLLGEFFTVSELTINLGRESVRLKGMQFVYFNDNFRLVEEGVKKTKPPKFDFSDMSVSSSFKSMLKKIQKGKVNTDTHCTYKVYEANLYPIKNTPVPKLIKLRAECVSRIKEKSSGWIHQAFLQYLIDIVDFYAPDCSKKKKLNIHGQPQFNWESYDNQGEVWLTTAIGFAEEGCLPMVDELFDMCESSVSDYEYISMDNLDKEGLEKILGDAKLNTRPDIVKWFGDYCKYLVEIIEWHLAKWH